MKLFIMLFVAAVTFGCTPPKTDTPVHYSPNTPKLVVGIVVDQMRYDYLIRFAGKYGDSGFKKLLKDGFHCNEHHFSYMPTYTGPGHASIFTGTTPETHGIIANDWYNKRTGRMMYCAEDMEVNSVGGDFKKEKRSPKNILVTGLGDQIKIATSYKGKSIGISIKDRSAIFPAGKLADAAYWFKGSNVGKFISSTYYMDKLPDWVNAFNDLKKPQKYLSQNWETLLPIEQYTESNADNNPYERSLMDGEDPVFPYDLKRISAEKGLSIIKTTPFGNDLLLDFAKAAVVGEELGKDSVMDWLTISFSSPDYVGHTFGPRSIEVEDTYLRLDRNIADLIAYLDETVGEGEYILFLTADHGAALVPQELKDKGVEVGYYSDSTILAEVEKAVSRKFGQGLIDNYSNYQFFLNRKNIEAGKWKVNDICNEIVKVAMRQKGVKSAMIRRDLERNQYTDRVQQTVQKGWNVQRSGDVALVIEPGWLSNYWKNGGTSHGSPWTYDTHVPLIFYGYGIESGYTNELTRVEDIVPTVAAVIGVQPPMGSTGIAIYEALIR